MGLPTLIFTLILAACDVTSSDVMDASDVTWAHAVNSKEYLEKELKGDLDFLEADVSMGTIHPFGQLTPIMAHPPDTTSDISLEVWLDMVIASGSDKGIKLDFKSMNAVEPSLKILKQKAHKINGSLWLNADIIYGPIQSKTVPLENFVPLCQDYFPESVLSLGWTTYWYPKFPPDTWHYEWRHVREMADIIRCAQFQHSNSTFTFPVRGIFASRSINRLQWLLDVVPTGSLTLWTSLQDPLSVEDLLLIRKSFPKNKVYYDIPEDLAKEFMKVKDRIEYVPRVPIINGVKWIKLTKGHHHQQEPDCYAHTYVNDRNIVFGASVTTAVLLKKLITVDDTKHLRAEGKIQFFNNEDQPMPTSHQLSIIVLDVSNHFKNSSTTSSEYMDMSEGDTDVWWSAINASYLYTFDQNSSDYTRIFRLDTTMDHIFQAWTVPSYALEDHVSLGDLIKEGTTEVPYSKRVVLPNGPIMIGFISSGPGYVVIEDLAIEDIQNNYFTGASNTLSVTFGVIIFATLALAAKHYIFY